MKLTKEQRRKVMSIISENTICAVRKDQKVIWNCNGMESKTSRELNLDGTILRCNEELIVTKIMMVLGDDSYEPNL
jgi:hypothetical protein